MIVNWDLEKGSALDCPSPSWLDHEPGLREGVLEKGISRAVWQGAAVELLFDLGLLLSCCSAKASKQRRNQKSGASSRSSAAMASFSGDETAPFFGFLGAAAALVFSCMGAAYGTAKSGVGVASMGVMRPELVMKSIVPVVMAGVLGIYGLIIAVIISTGINPKAKSYYLFDGYAHLSSGLACGLAGLSAGMAIGIVGDAGVRANAQQPKLFVGMILILIFAEALALYGLIVGIILSSRAGQSRAE
ncbi:V-type proton ATPase 16 kDa proteolipid subunit [Apostasia shenzhenica]|uniref:V-type proton ATPase proteolipid subunit n=2 Tax=Mesangiospermae TaxID=1437183 RepID=A0A2H9ZUM7_9ASPA|nr:V-type proton ATPase 16 kDa proteolipid subunit [Apostasia shenzhenica]